MLQNIINVDSSQLTVHICLLGREFWQHSHRLMADIDMITLQFHFLQKSSRYLLFISTPYNLFLHARSNFRPKLHWHRYGTLTRHNMDMWIHHSLRNLWYVVYTWQYTDKNTHD